MLWQQLLLAQLVDSLLIHPTISIRAVGRATLLNMHAGLPAAARAAAVQGAAARAAQRRRAVTRMLHPLPRTMTRMLTSKMTKMRQDDEPMAAADDIKAEEANGAADIQAEDD